MSETEWSVSIPLEKYEDMLQRLKWLKCLEAAGVDNWEGVDTAIDYYLESKKDE